ncbi:MAG: hypothetical protein IRZ04_21390 [Rhodospirillales bacterium]|nr:hypothetical protein [Rhodospirillales bacterium]
MATFTITGTIDGLPATLSWTNGVFDGDDRAVARAQALVELDELLWRTPTGPAFRADVTPAWVALLTGLEVFDQGREAEVAGDPVEFPDDELPAEAVA